MSLLGDEKDHRTTVFSDIDGCLILWPGPKPGSSRYYRASKEKEIPKPNAKIVEYLKSKKKEGFTIVLWSIGGAEHCRWAAKLCGIENIVDYCLAKPIIMVDDHHKWYLNPKRTWVDENGEVIPR
jgi:hypothetical protein